MSVRYRIGMITPSSNTVLEPIVARMVAAIPGASAHFSRFQVTRIGLDAASLGQFQRAPMLQAASLLADARVQAIVWNGTSGGWLGLQADRDLCHAIEDQTGIAATTATLALHDLLRNHGLSRVGLITPYQTDLQQRIIAEFAASGIHCIAEQHLELTDNVSFSEVAVPTMAQMAATVAAARPDAIAAFCTNFGAAPLAAAWEAEWGIPVLDSVAVAVRGGFDLCGAGGGALDNWGSDWGRLISAPYSSPA